MAARWAAAALVGLGVLAGVRWRGRRRGGAAGEVQSAIAAVTPYYAFKGIDRFYDISGFLAAPRVFAMVVDEMERIAASLGCDVVCGIDARGFVLGPPLALRLGKPFVMARKADKLPSCVTGSAYRKEYAGDDTLSMPTRIVQPGDRVLLVDDLVATGGSVLAALELVERLGASCCGIICVIEIAQLGARARLASAGHAAPILTLVDEAMLTLSGADLDSRPS